MSKFDAIATMPMYVERSYLEKNEAQPKELVAYNKKSQRFVPIQSEDLTCWNRILAFFQLGKLAHLEYNLKRVCKAILLSDNLNDEHNDVQDRIYLLAIRLFSRNVRYVYERRHLIGHHDWQRHFLDKTLRKCFKEMNLAEKVFAQVCKTKDILDTTGPSEVDLSNTYTIYYRDDLTTRGDLDIYRMARFARHHDVHYINDVYGLGLCYEDGEDINKVRLEKDDLIDCDKTLYMMGRGSSKVVLEDDLD